MGQRRGHRWAFSLLELLVVIGIIAILLAILLVALARARRQANTAACLARLRELGHAMQAYAGDNRGWLPGSPYTTGRYLWRRSASGTYESAGYTTDNVPGPAIELFDYMGPLAATMGMRIPDTPSGVDRLRTYRQMPIFACPANEYTATRAAGADVEEGPVLSYATPTAFMLLPPYIPTTLNTTWAGRVTMPTGGSSTDPAHFNFWSSPAGYAPKLERVGPPSRKICLADAARRIRHSGSLQFIYDAESDYADTLFSDFGPFYGVTRSYDRYAVNNPSADAIDARKYAYRHGGGRGDYRMNAVFFDGHAETLTEMESARPEYWLPSGSRIYRNTRLNATDTAFWPDVWTTYLQAATLTDPYVVP